MPKAFLLTNKRYEEFFILHDTAENPYDVSSGRQQVSSHQPIHKCQPTLPTLPESSQLSGNLGSKKARLLRRYSHEEELKDKIAVKADENCRPGVFSPVFQPDSRYPDEPVNLCMKEVDLFNLKQLAEVSVKVEEARSLFPPPLIPGLESKGNKKFWNSKNQKETGRKEKNVNKSREDREEEDGSTRDSNIPDSTSTRMIKESKHSCTECGKGFSTVSNLARHRQTHLSLSSSAVKKCPHCDKMYVSMPAFSMHLRTHNQGCKCKFCGKGFSRPWLLQGHLRTHTGEKPFKCSVCGKAFADKSNLRAHTQTHSNEKPYVCSRCGKPFALKSYLCKHVESSCMKSQNKQSFIREIKGNKNGRGVGNIHSSLPNATQVLNRIVESSAVHKSG